MFERNDRETGYISMFVYSLCCLLRETEAKATLCLLLNVVEKMNDKRNSHLISNIETDYAELFASGDFLRLC